MSTMDRLERAMEQARKLGLRVRYENLGGTLGGVCEVAGVRWLFIDLALTPEEQLCQVAQALSSELLAAKSPPKLARPEL